MDDIIAEKLQPNREKHDYRGQIRTQANGCRFSNFTASHHPGQANQIPGKTEQHGHLTDLTDTFVVSTDQANQNTTWEKKWNSHRNRATTKEPAKSKPENIQEDWGKILKELENPDKTTKPLLVVKSGYEDVTPTAQKQKTERPIDVQQTNKIPAQGSGGTNLTAENKPSDNIKTALNRFREELAELHNFLKTTNIQRRVEILNRIQSEKYSFIENLIRQKGNKPDENIFYMALVTDFWNIKFSLTDSPEEKSTCLKTAEQHLTNLKKIPADNIPKEWKEYIATITTFIQKQHLEDAAKLKSQLYVIYDDVFKQEMHVIMTALDDIAKSTSSLKERIKNKNLEPENAFYCLALLTDYHNIYCCMLYTHKIEGNTYQQHHIAKREYLDALNKIDDENLPKEWRNYKDKLNYWIMGKNFLCR